MTDTRALREIQQADASVITLSPDEQLRFWQSLSEVRELTPAQRRLAAIMRGLN